MTPPLTQLERGVSPEHFLLVIFVSSIEFVPNNTHQL